MGQHQILNAKGRPVNITVRTSHPDMYQRYIYEFDIPSTEEETTDGDFSFRCESKTEEPTASFEQIQAELVTLKAVLDDPDFESKIVKEMPRKKDGTLAKGRVYYPFTSEFYCPFEDSYGNFHPSIKAKALSDTEIEVTAELYRDSW